MRWLGARSGLEAMTMAAMAVGRRYQAGRIILVVLANLLVGFGLLTAKPASAAEMHPLEIVTKSGVQVFTVEEAKTEEERERGLMFRTALPEGQGMIFDFSPEQNVSMWMKNTLIPLDMIFIRADGRILRIAENTKIKSEDIIPSGGPVRA